MAAATQTCSCAEYGPLSAVSKSDTGETTSVSCQFPLTGTDWTTSWAQITIVKICREQIISRAFTAPSVMLSELGHLGKGTALPGRPQDPLPQDRSVISIPGEEWPGKTPHMWPGSRQPVWQIIESYSLPLCGRHYSFFHQTLLQIWTVSTDLPTIIQLALLIVFPFPCQSSPIKQTEFVFSQFLLHHFPRMQLT